MNKIVMLIGTNRTPSQSNSHKAAGIVKNSLLSKITDVQVDILGLTEYRIDMCKGCGSCFNTGECSLKDDLHILKEALLEADHIMIVSPVYAHHISGILKNAIDRLSHWMHVMKLLGKTSSSVAVTSWNGPIYVSDYLEKTLQFFGTIYVHGLEISVDKPPMLDEDHWITDTLIEGFVHRIGQSLKGEFSLDNLDTQILSFNRYKEIYTKPEIQNFEGHAWKTWPALQHNGFLDAYQYQRMVHA